MSQEETVQRREERPPGESVRGRKEQSKCVHHPPFSPCGSHSKKIEGQDESQRVWPHFRLRLRRWLNQPCSDQHGSGHSGEEVVRHFPS